MAFEKVIKIEKYLTLYEQKELSNLLKDFKDIFTWSYVDMPDIDPQIVTHNIVLPLG